MQVLYYFPLAAGADLAPVVTFLFGAAYIA